MSTEKFEPTRPGERTYTGSPNWQPESLLALPPPRLNDSGATLDALPPVTIDGVDKPKYPDNGQYQLGECDRIVKTVSEDGAKTREFRYGPYGDLAAVTIDHNRTYVHIPGSNAWAYYENNQYVGQWNGQISIDSRTGRYSYTEANGGKHTFGSGRDEIADDKVVPFDRARNKREQNNDPFADGNRDRTGQREGDRQTDNPVASRDVSEARRRLLDAASQAGLDTNLVSKFTQEIEQRSSKYWLNDQQIARTFDNVREIMTAPQGKWYSRQQMKDLAMDALHDAARVCQINQSNHPVCNTGTVSVYGAARHPDLYTDMVKQVALKGTWMSTEGLVHVPRESVMPGADEKQFRLEHAQEDVRNLASEIVQNTLVNAVYEKDHVIRDGKVVHAKYIMGAATSHLKFDPRLGQHIVIQDPEDKLVDEAGNQKYDKKGEPKTDPGFTEMEIQAAAKLFFGYKMPYLDGPYSIDHGPLHYDLPTGERLMNYKQERQLPLGVHTMGGQHVQTIHDVEFKDGQYWVHLDNQHGDKTDGWITLNELHATEQDFNAEQPVREYPGGPLKNPQLQPGYNQDWLRRQWTQPRLYPQPIYYNRY